MKDWMKWYEQPYADDDAKLNDFVEDHLKRVSWHLFEEQEKIVHMANETENGIPKMKEGAIQHIQRAIEREFDWLIGYMTSRILVSYLKGNIDPSDEVKSWFQDDLPEGEDEQFWNEIDDFIWEDYLKNIPEEQVRDLWEKWGKAPRKED